MKNYLKKAICLSMLIGAGLVTTAEAKQQQVQKAVSVLTVQETAIEATFEGYTDKDGYTFVLGDGKKVFFEEVSDEVLKNFDLKSNALKGKKFKVTYTVEENDEGEVYTIVGFEKKDK
ncbi:hypothetical protein ACQY1Q_09685 [Tenacibaculum sp. TC6]|uniref:hypothetical protein n=1 Tax=Tenacibaculum sp. TC6 TaxID=3423223 RepID=UPI003D3617BC